MNKRLFSSLLVGITLFVLLSSMMSTSAEAASVKTASNTTQTGLKVSYYWYGNELTVNTIYNNKVYSGTVIVTNSSTGIAITVGSQTIYFNWPEDSSNLQNAHSISQANTAWWDGVYFDYGYPVYYPHPDTTYYQIYTNLNTFLYGNSLIHYQLGTAFISTIGALGPTSIGAALGGLFGAMISGALGAVVGALLGAIIGAILTYIQDVVWVSEQGTIWWWINIGFWKAIHNIPAWVWALGALLGMEYVATWLWNHVTYWRVGDGTFINSMGMSSPP